MTHSPIITGRSVPRERPSREKRGMISKKPGVRHYDSNRNVVSFSNRIIDDIQGAQVIFNSPGT
jgi:hypothetical protein